MILPVLVIGSTMAAAVISKNYMQSLCRRGMKELDVVLEDYLDKYFEQAEEQELQALIELLQMEDIDLWYFISQPCTKHRHTLSQLHLKLQQQW